MITKDVFWSTAPLLNLIVDLIFFDTTNTTFEIDELVPSELKAFGKSMAGLILEPYAISQRWSMSGVDELLPEPPFAL